LRAIATELAVGDRLRLLGYVPDADLEGLWSLAACAVFPTLGEGFGLPVLEAMERGVPVACSDIDVLREIGGDEARYFDPRDERAAAAVIANVMDDPPSQGAARDRARSFSWEACARGTFEAYERALHTRCTSA
jgi:glycosyltransferase involved in cell wall biosynthesis